MQYYKCKQQKMEETKQEKNYCEFRVGKQKKIGGKKAKRIRNVITPNKGKLNEAIFSDIGR